MKHHFINHISIQEYYSAGEFERESILLLNKLFERQQIVVCAGGTGLYIKAITNGFDNIPKIDPSIRLKLVRELEENGLSTLQIELKEVDLISFESIDIQNPQRVIRALEIYRGTQKPISSFQQSSRKTRNFKTIKIGLEVERSKLYDRINQRVDQMLEVGLLEEVISLQEQKHLNALQTVGYSELFEYLEGHISLERAVELIKRDSRRYAKRQLTWFRRDEEIVWFDQAKTSTVLNHIEPQL